ncbi:MAG TPA: OmpA family protein [Paracoccaceae bacterium]|nr:OmpA family protein [Paracoccaceae bacterium]HMO71244.1 OmpA family protein [Paracoccaceae bacterium]
MTGPRFLAAAAAILSFGPAPGAAALPLEFPAPARATAATSDALASLALPVGPWDGRAVPHRRAEGSLQRQAWRVDAPGLPTLALLSPLRDQIAAQGFRILYECDTQICGGFDFRYALDLLPEPQMHVDLGDFRFLAAEKGDEALILMVSRSAAAGFVQLSRVTPADPAATILAANPAPVAEILPPQVGAGLPAAGDVVTLSSANASAAGLAGRLADAGGAVLEDLVFASGAAVLEPGDYPSLAALADWLRADPSRRVTLVGHTDAAGGLETNIALSRRRADSVRAKLIGNHGVAAQQVRAEGVGFLAPRASNETDEGRQANRRVEAVVTAP